MPGTPAQVETGDSGHHQRPEGVRADRGGHQQRPAGLAIADRHRPALGLRVAAADLLGEGDDGAHHVLDRLARLGIGAEADEVAGMAGLHRHADLAVGLEAADARPVAGARIDDDEGALARIGRRRRGRRAHARHPVVDGLRQVMAVQHQVEVEAEDVPHRVVLAFQEGVAALAQHVEEQHRALPRVERVGGPGKHVGVSGHGIPPRVKARRMKWR